MSIDLIRELEKLGTNVDVLDKIPPSKSAKVKLKRYHALLNRISKCSEVDITPDELISSLNHKCPSPVDWTF